MQETTRKITTKHFSVSSVTEIRKLTLRISGQTWSEALLEGFSEGVVYLLLPEICLEDFNVFTKRAAYSKSWIFERDCVYFLGLL